jgi:metal-dependent amidase/aminoacylase/carboxypeptidase family protein
VGVRAGAITAACDKVKVTLAGPGGHTARPHLTADVVYALGKIVTELPAALSRRVDPRAGLSLVWGHVSAGSAANAIPDGGVVEGTVRCLDAEVWRSAIILIEELVQSVATPYGVTAKVEYLSAMPPTVNEPASAAMISQRRRRDARPGRGDGDAAEPGRRGLRLVPAPGTGGHGAGSAPARPVR